MSLSETDRTIWHSEEGKRAGPRQRLVSCIGGHGGLVTLQQPVPMLACKPVQVPKVWLALVGPR